MKFLKALLLKFTQGVESISSKEQKPVVTIKRRSLRTHRLMSVPNALFNSAREFTAPFKRFPQVWASNPDLDDYPLPKNYWVVRNYRSRNSLAFSNSGLWFSAQNSARNSNTSFVNWLNETSNSQQSSLERSNLKTTGKESFQGRKNRLLHRRVWFNITNHSFLNGR